IDERVAVEVDRMLSIARGHELRQTHRTGVRALDLERIDVELVRKQQELLELFAKILLAARAVESDRRERVDDAIRAGMATEQGLDTKNADDHFRGNAELRFGAAQLRFVRLPELRARRD